ncbi:family 43 glycosylhydrolase [Phormidesmis sp. 146-35]
MIPNLFTDIGLATLLESLPRGRSTTAKFARSLRQKVYQWDPWIFKDGDVYRMFYLEAPKPKPEVDFWSQGTIYGAISPDLINWQTLGVMLAPEPNNSWESGRMLAGSIYKEDGIYYLFYSASGGGVALKDERIGLATSIDGVNWRRTSSNHLFLESEWGQWYGRQTDSGHFHWRDPYIVKDEATSKYYMYICAYSQTNHLKQLTTDVANKYQGCVGLAISDHIAGPYKLLPPVAGPTISGMEDWPFVEMERPQVIYRDGIYHLFFSCWPWQLNPNWLSRVRPKHLRESSVYWLVSNSMTGPFRPVSEIPMVNGSQKTGLYATNFLQIQNEPEEWIAMGWYHRIYALQVAPRFQVQFGDQEINITIKDAGIKHNRLNDRLNVGRAS